MKLGRKQEIFSEALALLLQFARFRGYSIRIGEVERSQKEAIERGFPNSNHTRRLAADLHLFLGGKYLYESADHATLGAFWESLSGEFDGEQLEFAWGGRFNDGNHYSLKHMGFS